MTIINAKTVIGGIFLMGAIGTCGYFHDDICPNAAWEKAQVQARVNEFERNKSIVVKGVLQGARGDSAMLSRADLAQMLKSYAYVQSRDRNDSAATRQIDSLLLNK
jgi:hypothetical protein